MKAGRSTLTREEECERLIELHRELGTGQLVMLFERQLRTLNGRAQHILAICSFLVSSSVVVTAGHLIGRLDFQYERLAAVVLTLAGTLAIAAAAVVCGGVIRLRFTTQQRGVDLRAWILSNLAHRDGKSRAYRLSVLLVLTSLILYQLALGLVLFRLGRVT